MDITKIKLSVWGKDAGKIVFLAIAIEGDAVDAIVWDDGDAGALGIGIRGWDFIPHAFVFTIEFGDVAAVFDGG